MNKKYFKFFGYSLILMLGMFFHACTDEPGSLGEELLSARNIVLKDTVFDSGNTIISDSTVHTLTNIGSSSTLLVGKCKNMIAYSLIRFTPSISTRTDDIVNGRAILDSAVLSLTRVYTMGDSTQKFSMSAHEVNTAWTSSGFTIDSVNNSLFGTEAGVEYRYDTTAYSVLLDKSIVYKWLKAAVDTNYKPLNKGIILKPKSDCGRIYGFQALTSLLDGASLTVYLRKTDNVTDSTFTFTVQEDVHAAALIDSSSIRFKDAIFVQNSIILSGLLKFNINSLPKDAVLNSAELILKKHRDTISNVYSITGNPNYGINIEVGYVADSVKLTINSGLTSEFSYSGDVFKANITKIVSQFLLEKKNILLSMYSSYPTIGTDVTVFYNGMAANPDDRPKLKIVYSKKGN